MDPSQDSEDRSERHEEEKEENNITPARRNPDLVSYQTPERNPHQDESSEPRARNVEQRNRRRRRDIEEGGDNRRSNRVNYQRDNPRNPPPAIHQHVMEEVEMEVAAEGEEEEEEMEEYEPASSEEEVKRDHDYDYQKKEYLNPIIVKLPDGSLNIATESKDPNIKEVLWWNWKSRLLYQAKYDTVSWHSWNEIVITKGNNSRNTMFVKWMNWEVDLLVSDGAYKVFWTRWGNIFTITKRVAQNRTDYLHFFMN